MKNLIPVRTIVEHAISLIDSQGNFVKLDGSPGNVQHYGDDTFEIIYTTPFSGLEFYLGEKEYGIDIWFNNKKVLNCVFSDPAKIKGGKRPTEWISSFFEVSARPTLEFK